MTPKEFDAWAKSITGSMSIGWEWNSKVQGLNSGQNATLLNDPTTKTVWWSYNCTDFSDPKAQAWYTSHDLFIARPVSDPPAGAITPEQLADRARAMLDLPTPQATLSPVAANQIVRLPTWVWVSGLGVQTATAATRFGYLSVTVTVTPHHLQLATDLAATLYPTGGNCADLGTPYQTDATGNPPCGIGYTRAGTGTITVQAAWTARWTASTGTAGDLPGSTTQQQIPTTVSQIQTVN